jgi:hypothetical protein
MFAPLEATTLAVPTGAGYAVLGAVDLSRI